MDDINTILEQIEQDENLQLRLCDLAGELNETLGYKYDRTFDWSDTLKELYANLQLIFDGVDTY